MLGICQVCGNDDASLALCSDCLGPEPGQIAPVITRALGGQDADWQWLAELVATHLGWCGQE